MTLVRIAFGLFIAGLAGQAYADVYKCVDERGNITYTNDKPAPGQKGCTLLSRDQPVNSFPAPKKPPVSSTASSGFPKVGESEQKGRDTDRRKILETELASEQKALEDAKKELTEQEAQRLGDERNYQKYLDRIQTYRDKIKQHETNIEKLKTELANLK